MISELEDVNFSSLSIKDQEDNIKAIYDRFKDLKDVLLKHGELSPYIEHQYNYMVKAFSLFVDYYNQYVYSLPMAIQKIKEEINDYPSDEA